MPISDNQYMTPIMGAIDLLVGENMRQRQMAEQKSYLSQQQAEQRQYEQGQAELQRNRELENQAYGGKMTYLQNLLKDESLDPESKKQVHQSFLKLLQYPGAALPDELAGVKQQTYGVPEDVWQRWGAVTGMDRNALTPQQMQILMALDKEHFGRRLQEKELAEQIRHNQATERLKEPGPDETMVEIPGYGSVPVKHAGSIANLMKTLEDKNVSPERIAGMLDTNMRQIEGEQQQILGILQSDKPKKFAEEIGMSVEDLRIAFKKNNDRLRELRQQYNSLLAGVSQERVKPTDLSVEFTSPEQVRDSDLPREQKLRILREKFGFE